MIRSLAVVAGLMMGLMCVAQPKFTKENERISYDRYKLSAKGRVFFELSEKVNMKKFLENFELEFCDANDFADITVINHRDSFLNIFPMDYRHMNGYVVARKGDKYIAKHVYLVKIPSFDELLSVAMLQCKNEYDECLVVTIDWYESPRFTQYTNNIMYGLSYNRSENLVEIYSKHQTIEKFHAFMQKANKIITTWDGILYDDGTFEGE
jgi:predicted AlkP superfamily pyrophosphatase or phosphodiesterase